MKTVLLALLAFQTAKVDLPQPYHSTSANNGPRVVNRPAGAQLTLPAGFKIEEWAEGFKRPRFLLQGPSGEVLVSDTIIGGSVVAIRGKDRRDVLTKLDRPYGMAFYQDWLYVAEPTSVKRYKYDSRTASAGPGQEVVRYEGMGRGHATRTIAFDSKGKMYVAVGSASNVDHGEPAERAAINRYNADGTGHELYATGTRNPVGLRFYPGTDTLWASVQERDHLGDDLVPDYFTSLRPGGFYGWPYAYIGKNADPRRTEHPEMVAKTITPDVVLGAHVAVLDALFYTGKMFPARYQGGAFVCQHGSWNRAQRVGYDVVFIPFKDKKPAGKPEQFLGGWRLDPARREVWGRPVGLLQLADGSLLLSDDGGNRIWRISYSK